MATATILSGDFTVYFAGDAAGDKQIKWTGSTDVTATRTVNELYTALQDLFDDNTLGAGDYIAKGFGVPMRAVTPRVYKIGTIESGDDEPWFIDQETTEHLTGGSIATIGWNRIVTFNAGIVSVRVNTGSTIVKADVGNTITHSDGDSGTLLDVESSVYEFDADILWIRPDSSATADNFDSTTGGTLTCNGHTATQETGQASRSDDIEWYNFATIGTLQANTEIEVAQYGLNSAGTAFEQGLIPRYWPEGQIDRLFKVTDRSGALIDLGRLDFYARKENTLYDSFEIIGAEGRNVVPLATAPDLNNSSSLTSIAGFSITFGATTADINQDSTNENYSVTINCGGASLSDVYRHLQYLTRDGSTVDIGGVQGQQYTGLQALIGYTSIDAGVQVGDFVVSNNLSNKLNGYVASINTAGTYVTLHTINGDSLSVNDDLIVGGVGSTSINDVTVGGDLITPKKATPFGNFAGGRFFGARGVLITNFAATNQYELIDDQGNTVEPPTTRTFTLTGMKDGTEVRIYRASDSTAIAGVEDMTGGVGTTINNGDGTVTVTGSTDDNDFTFSWVYQDPPTNNADLPIFIAIINNQYEYLSLTGLSLTNADQSIPVQQRFDRNFSNP